jgi:hypothetical protein
VPGSSLSVSSPHFNISALPLTYRGSFQEIKLLRKTSHEN